VKKTVTFLVALLYLFSSVGATVRLHYCMGSLADRGIGYDKSVLCPACGMNEEESEGCCKDEHHFIKNKVDQKAGTFVYDMTMITEAAVLYSSFGWEPAHSGRPVIPTVFSNALPSHLPPVYLLVRNLRI